MSATRLDLPTRLYALTVIVAGLACGAALWLRGPLAVRDLWLVVVFGGLALIFTAFSATYQGYYPHRVVFQASSAFLFALLLLAPPAAVCLGIAAYTIADWIVNRRRTLMALFNLAQLTLALGAATLVLRWLPDPAAGWHPTRPADVAVGTLALVTFSGVNQALTFGVLSVVARRLVFKRNPITRGGLLNESICLTSGIAMAALWLLWPPLVLFGLMPLWILSTLLGQLGRREQELEAHRDELHSLQQLGLELSGELDEPRLHRTIVHVAAEAFRVPHACLLLAESGQERPLRAVAHEGLRGAALAKAARGFEACCTGEDVFIEEPLSEAMRTALRLGSDAGLLGIPLRMDDERRGCLLLVRDRHRRRFDETDTQRARTFAPFVETALSNARLVANFREMQAQLVHTERMSALGLLTSGVAHELNNPLTSIQGYAELLAAEESDTRRRSKLEAIAREAARAGQVVRQLLNFARPGTGDAEAVDAVAVLRRVVALREHALRLQGIEVELHLQEPLPLVSAETTALHQVVLNLLVNAEHALARRPPPRRVRLAARPSGERVELCVEDNGPGVPEALRERIFLPFFTTKPVGEGTGLGLAISRRLVERYGGSLRLVPAAEGARFVIALKRAARSPAPPPARPSREAELVSGGRRLLVVDDEPAICGLVRDTLEPLGWQVDAAADGVEALAKVRGADYDVLLVDVRMPRMDGRAFCEALQRERPELARRVILSSGHLEADVADLCAAEAHWLAKPYDLRTLVERVNEVAALRACPQ